MAASHMVDVDWADGFQHEALFYAGDDEFLAATVPFVREGVAQGEAVLVAVPGTRLRALQAEIDGAPGVAFVDMEEIGRNPAAIIPAWSDFVTANGGGTRPLRGIGEPIWAGRTPTELIECQRHESLLNVAFAAVPNLRILCPYDTDSLPDDVLTEACHSHPWLCDGAGDRHLSSCCPDVDTIAAFDVALSPSPAGLAPRPFVLDDLTDVRRELAAVAEAAGLTESRAADFVLAAHEIVTNSVRHAGGRGVLRLWHDDRTLYCDVEDRGCIRDPLAGRVRPTEDAHAGRGLWMANQLCDLVQIRTFPYGNQVRLHMHR